MPTGGFWVTPPDTLTRGVDAYVRSLEDAALAWAHDLAEHLERAAKLNHPFHNVTGRAESGFQGLVRTDGRGRVGAVLRQKYADRAGLEYWHAGKYATIQPTLRLYASSFRAFCAAHGLHR